MVTDISDQHFAKIGQDIGADGIESEFIQTDACDLTGVEPGSIDLLVCNYALCEISARPGRGVLALQRFLEVLRPGGHLHIEEEYPITAASSPPQNIWAVTWRILKSVVVLVERRMPTAEYEPDVLCAICESLGFEDVTAESRSRMDSARWLHPRIHMLKQRLPGLPNENLRAGFVELMQELQQRADKVGRVEIPVYQVSARKPAGRLSQGDGR